MTTPDGAVCSGMTFTTAPCPSPLDGFVAGPDQTTRGPARARRRALHRWMFDDPPRTRSTPAGGGDPAPRVAYVMGRNMFGPVRGPWSSYDGDWRGWWGEDPPYHAPVFVLTHHEHEPIEMAGGTTFHFVTGGLRRGAGASPRGGDGDVDIAGGASAVRQALAAVSSTSSRSTSPRCCSAPASGSSTARSRRRSRSSRASTQRWRRTFATGSSAQPVVDEARVPAPSLETTRLS